MKRAYNIKKRIKKMRLNASAELDAKIDARFSNVPAKLEMKPPAEIQPTIWRIMMNNPIIKYAAILVVAAVVLFGISILIGKDSSSLENGMEITRVAELLEQLTNESVTLSTEAMIAKEINLEYNENVPNDQALAMIYSALESVGLTAVQRESGIYIIPAGSTDELIMEKNLADKVFVVGNRENEYIRIIFDDSLLKSDQYIEIQNSGNNEFHLEQVDTGTIGKSKDNFPAYACYIDFQIKSNFDLNLGAERITRGTLFEHDKWDAYFIGSNRVIGNGDFIGVTLCVCAWNVSPSILPNDIIDSQVTILIQPDK